MSEQKSNHIRTVVKTDGTIVPFDPDRLNKWAQFADNYGLQWSEIVLNAYKKCTDGCSTKDLHTAMISACVEMETHDHLKMAGRLALGNIYKDAHGGFKSIPTLKEFYNSMVEKGYWIAMDYSDAELDILNNIIDHNKNLEYNFTTLSQMENRYLIKDLHSKICYESPQFMFMGICMANMENEDKEIRIEQISGLYNNLSDLKINLATPMLVNLRTPSRGLASCNVYTVGDTASSISAGNHIAEMMTCASAGIGSHMLIRSKGDPIRGGRVIHQGKLPYYKVTEAVVHASKQACYDDKTEILTENGFVHIDDFVTNPMYHDVKVAQVDKDRNLTYVVPSELHVYDNEGDMYEFDFDGSKFLVTENHEMVFRKFLLDEDEEHSNDSYDYTRVEAKDITYDDLLRANFDNTAKYKGSIFEATYDHYLAFITNFFAEVEKGDEETIITFNGDNYLLGSHVAESLFSKLNKRFNTEHVDEYQVPSFDIVEEHVINKNEVVVKVKNHVMDIIDDAFNELKELEKNQFISIIDYVNERVNKTTKKGNKVKEVNVGNTYNVPENNISMLQFLLTQNGISSKIVEDSKLEIYGDTYYVGSAVNINIITDFKEKVYCVTVPTNNIIVRRDGSTLVCGNSRGGANTSFFPIIDPEIDDLLALKNPMTVQQKRIRNIDYAVQVNRLFVEKVAKNEDWFTISYYYAPDLYDAFYSGDYDAFKEMYLKYENHEKSTKHKARALAIKMLTESVETGRMYLNYIDEMNRHTPFKDTIYSSNLCVAPETMIMTKDGEVEIHTLKDQLVELWNGEEWSKSIIRKTGTGKKLMVVGVDNASEIECTPEHEFYVIDEEFGVVTKKKARDLKVGERLEHFKCPTTDNLVHEMVITSVLSHTQSGIVKDTYCAFEPLRNRIMVNGVVTGNCLEIALPTKPFPNMMDLYNEDSEGEIGLCSLASIVVGRVSDEEYEEVAYLTTKFIDNTIDIMDYPFPSLRGTARKRRSIGVGITNLAHLLASNDLSYASKEGKEMMHKVAETHSYWLYRASLRLAKERGVAEWMSKSKYKDGWLPIDTYNRRVDELGDMKLRFDWEQLRKEIIEVGGIRNSTITAYMPVESCLSRYTEIRTTNGIMTLEDIFKLTNLNLDEEWVKLDKFTGGKWFDLETPIEVPTLEGNKEVDKIWVNGNSSYMEIELDDGTVVKATHHHKFLVRNYENQNDWVMAMDIEEGDYIINVESSTFDNKVVGVTNMDDSIVTLDIEVKDAHHYILSNGSVVHNSSQLTNTTNSLYPIRQLRVIKESNTGKNVFLAPDLETIGHKYDIAWKLDSKDLIDTYAIFQKFTDQAISSDLYLTFDESESVSTTELLKAFIYASNMGLKTRYYLNSAGGIKELGSAEEEVFVEENVDDGDDCVACKL